MKDLPDTALSRHHKKMLSMKPPASPSDSRNRSKKEKGSSPSPLPLTRSHFEGRAKKVGGEDAICRSSTASIAGVARVKPLPPT